MSRVQVALEKWTGGNTREEAKQKLVGYQEVRCHMIFDVKMSGLIRKAWLDAGGHMTDMPASVTYSSVVSRDSVRIAFIIAALNDLDIMSADIGNAYLNAPKKEKIWTVAGHEFAKMSCQCLMPKATFHPMNLQDKYKPIKYLQGSINPNTTFVMTWIPLTPQVQYQLLTDDTYNPKCTHNLMETQCNHSQYPILVKKICTHDPSTNQVSKSYKSHPVNFPYPPDPGEHVLVSSSAPKTLVERDKLNLSSLIPPKEEMKSSFSWTCPFKSPTSSTLCFGEPTLGKINQETDVYMTKHMPKPSSGETEFPSVTPA